jgi:hypothetical protein
MGDKVRKSLTTSCSLREPGQPVVRATQKSAPLVPKLHLGTHLSAKLYFTAAERAAATN